MPRVRRNGDEAGKEGMEREHTVRNNKAAVSNKGLTVLFLKWKRWMPYADGMIAVLVLWVGDMAVRESAKSGSR